MWLLQELTTATETFLCYLFSLEQDGCTAPLATVWGIKLACMVPWML